MEKANRNQANSSESNFCLTNATVITSKLKHTLKYPNLPSAIPQIEALSVAQPTQTVDDSGVDSHTDEASHEQEDNHSHDPNF